MTKEMACSTNHPSMLLSDEEELLLAWDMTGRAAAFAALPFEHVELAIQAPAIAFLDGMLS